MKPKKNATMGMVMIVSLILLGVAVILFFFPFTKLLAETIIKGGQSSACSLTLFRGQGTADCPVSKVEIFKDKVEVDGKKFTEKGDESAQSMAKDAMARLLNICLSRGGGYNSQSFSRENFFPDESVCLECFNLIIDNDVGDVEDFIGYLRDTKANIGVSDKKYLETLTKDAEHLQAYMEYGAARGLAPSEGTFTFNPGVSYTIFFMGIKKGEITHLWDKISGTIRGDFIRVFLRNNDAYFSYITESSRISEVCNRKVN